MGNGTVSIKDGKIIVKDPEEGGRQASLGPPSEGGAIYINGELLEKETPVNSNMEFEIENIKVQENKELELWVQENKMEAFMRAKPGNVYEFVLKDEEENTFLRPQFVKQLYASKELTEDEVRQELDNKKVFFGIDEREIQRMLESQDGEWYKIAVGQPPVQGRDGHIDFFMSTEPKKISYDDEEDKVNLRDVYEYPEVEQGVKIGRIYDPVPGKPGKDVTGTELPPAEVKEVNIKLVEGLDLTEYNEIISLKEGVLIYAGNNLKVTEILVHREDVDIDSGNIRFKGAIKVVGDVHEGMTLDAGSDIFVVGNCYGANVYSVGNFLTKGNVIKSDLKVGMDGIVFNRLGDVTRLLRKDIDLYKENLYNIKNRMIEKTGECPTQYVNEISVSLYKDKVENVLDYLHRMENIVEGTHLEKVKDEKTETFWVLLQKMRNIKEDNCTEEFMLDLDEKLGKMEEVINFVEEVEYMLECGYSQNTDMICGGDVYIKGAGAYLTRIFALGSVNIKGVFRGGYIRANGDIFVREASFKDKVVEGDDLEDKCRIKTSLSGKVSIGEAKDNILVKVGDSIHKITEGSKDVVLTAEEEL